MEMGAQDDAILNCHCKSQPSASSHTWARGADSALNFLLYRSLVDLFDSAWTDECMIKLFLSNFSRDILCLIFTKGQHGYFTSIPFLLLDLLCVAQGI